MTIAIFTPPTGTAGTVWLDDIEVRRIKPDGLIPDLGDLRDKIAQAILGGSSTGYTAANIKTHMQNVREKSLDWVDGFFNALTGGSSSGVATATAASQAAALSDAIIANASAIALLQSQQTGGGTGGVVGGDDFEFTNSTDLGSNWSRTSVGTGPNLAVSDGHNAALDTISGANNVKNWNARRITAADALTATDYQVITTVIGPKVATKSDSDVYNAIIGRMSSDANHYVKVRIYQNSARIYYTTSGIAGETAVGNNYTSFTQSAGQIWALECGAIAGLRVYQARLNGVIVCTWTDSSNLSSVGASYRGWGFGASGVNAPFNVYYPSSITRITVADNTPTATVGNGFRVSRASTTGVTMGGASPVKVTNSFFDTVERVSAGWTFTAGSNNGVTVPFNGWYLFELRLPTATSRGVADSLVLFNGLNECARGIGYLPDTQFNDVFLHSTFIVYCNAGDVIYPGLFFNPTASFAGSASNTYSYFQGAFIGPQ